MLPLLPPCLRQFVAEVSFCLLLLGSPAAAIDGAAPSERPPPFDPRIHAGVSTCPLTVPLPLLPHAQFACPVPLTERDVLAGPARWSPWTHPPICVAVSRGKSERFCVYSNSRHGLSGFSLITTPKIAAATGDGVISERIRGNPMRPRLKPGVWESVMSKNGSKPSDIYDLDETAYVNDPETTPPYIIRRIPGKGLGVVAIRKIPQHSTIMADYASLVLNMEFPSAVRRVAGYALLHIAAEQIAEMGGEKIIRALDQSSSAAEDEIENVLRTNAFHAPLGEVDHMALYPEVSVSVIHATCRQLSILSFLPALVPRSLGLPSLVGLRVVVAGGV